MQLEVTKQMSPRTSRSIINTTLMLGLFSGMFSCPVVGQVPDPQVAGHGVEIQPKPVSLAHLYWHLLIYQHQLDQLASQHEAQGKDGRWLGSYLQTRLSMTDQEFAPIRESADRLDAAIAALNAQAKAVVSTVNASRTKESVPSANKQHYRRALKKLTAQREAAINAEIERLNTSLTPEAAQALQSYVQNTFSKNVSVVHMSSVQRQGRPFGPAATTGKVQP